MRELCELIHAETAEVLAVYGEEFYLGRPALTINRLGDGRAYYLAARITEDAFYQSFYSKLVEEAGVRIAISSKLPAGVMAQLRSDGDTHYVFLLNFSGGKASVELGDSGYIDAESGRHMAGTVELAVNGAYILKRRAGHRI